ncbi:hypothetical protein [Lutimonas sp.]|uniref:hypothetical protein n=1 Tax=Lutimonas sp. TaxID=1872403 RepID=UPI003D9B574A
MKIIKLISLFFIVSTSLLLVQCTTDPIPGPAGEDGIDGVDGVDGVSGTAECAACHNVSTTEEVHASYLFSGHYNENMDHGDGPLSQYANRGFPGGLASACTACHTSDGYIDWAETGIPMVGSAPVYPGTQTITCTTCHSKHSTFDFENDGFDYALRFIAPIELIADASYTIDYGAEDASSHTCASCHQPRSKFEDSLLENGNVNVGGRFGPHYGAQSTLLEGIQGAEIAGSLPYDAPTSAAHRSGSSCTSCHMGESIDLNIGKHSWNWTETSCTTCHTNGVPTEVAGFAEDVATLKDLLVDKGLLTPEGSPVPGEYPVSEASALWNYRMMYYDHSNGVHNPNYAKALVKNSIEALSAN